MHKTSYTHTLDDRTTPFCLCKVKKVAEKDGEKGAYVQWWDLSTIDDPNHDWFLDPYHCNATTMDGKPHLSYPWMPLTDFQDHVEMKKFKLSKNYKKKLSVRDGTNPMDTGVKRFKIAHKDVQKIKTHAMRMKSIHAQGTIFE